ncbi:MAG: hypothetical protein AAF541_02015 [Pseudomonadota bacterium]
MDYIYAWVVILGAAAVGAFGLWKICAKSRFGLLKWLASAVALAFFLTPVAVPNYPDQIAPAFVVAIFEILFQTNGEPQGSLRILGLSLTAVSLVTIIVYYLSQRGQKSRSTSSNQEPSA